MKYIGKLSDPSSYTVYSNYVLLEAAVSHGLLTTTLLPTLIQGLSSAQYVALHLLHLVQSTRWGMFVFIHCKCSPQISKLHCSPCKEVDH